ncbi:hypothetical protein [Actinomadura montaniterrae]|uniref:Uncharacterized protein n=1 Tax=Actinomadura montaniterrae TaxID=1803903 RepID=A0A6L3WBA5_9ACTN|nr:hypothetical protein [Actinomadura montaniterrae]KAB2390349.1 hypothetical protein F9B16_00495 [Actinomadura montaniterrae]
MGLIQIGVVGSAVLLRLTAFGWFAIISIIVSAFSFGIVPAIVLGPLVYAGFSAPQSAWPLLVTADVLLLVCALTFEDGGDNSSTSPLQVLTGSRALSGRAIDRACRFSGIVYLFTLPALVIWTIAS